MFDSAVKKTEMQIDLISLRKAVSELFIKYPLNETKRQLCLTSNKSIGQSVFDGTGSIYDYKKSVWLAEEKDFKYFIDQFRGTYFETLYELLQKKTDNKVARMRLMYLPPRACYSFHYDMTVRYHISVETNSGAFLIFKEEPPVHVAADGYVYYVDTRKWHTAANTGDEARIHLVVSLFNETAEIKKVL